MARAKRRYQHAGSEVLETSEEELDKGASEAMETGRRNVRQAQRSVLAAFDTFDIFGEPMARLMDQNRAMLQKMLRVMQEESLQFINRRLEHTGHAIESWRDCQGISGLVSVQQEWMLDFARDYAEQTKRFTEMMRELAEDGAATLSQVSSDVMKRRHAGDHRHAA